jgi:sarcosine oxidase subunit delta
VLQIECPWCGARDEREFSYGGQAGVRHPVDPEELTDEAWGHYLFFRDNPRGVWEERWCHVAGCRRWFDVRRDTVTNTMAAVTTAASATALAPAEAVR